MAIVYDDIRPYLKGGKIVYQDRFSHPISEQEAKHRIVENIHPAKNKPDTLVVVVM